MKTIAAIATAQGSGGIGIVRISGEKAIEISDKVFKSIDQNKLSNQKGYRAKYGYTFDKEGKIDETIALIFRAPKSYTGEDVVELSCHGGVYITRRLLRAVLESGAEMAGPGEFTKRAFLNGKMDLTQAESVMDLISAKGKRANDMALSIREGSLVNKIEEIKSKLIEMTAHLCVWADYPEEDIQQLELKVLKKDIDSINNTLQKVINNYDSGCAIKEGIRTVLIGKPNVGKSTLMNMLSGYEKSIVTDIPGTTRDTIEETVMLGDIQLRLIDTAGIRETENYVEKIGVDRAKESIISAGLKLIVIDGSKEIDDEDIKILEEAGNENSIAIINKIDIDNKIDKERISKYASKVVEISAKEKKGIEDLKEAVYDIIGMTKIDASEVIISNERQFNIIKKAYKCTQEADEILKIGMTLDAITVLLQDAIQELMELSGERASDKVIEEVFSKFCVGK